MAILSYDLQPFQVTCFTIPTRPRVPSLESAIQNKVDEHAPASTPRRVRLKRPGAAGQDVKHILAIPGRKSLKEPLAIFLPTFLVTLIETDRVDYLRAVVSRSTEKVMSSMPTISAPDYALSPILTHHFLSAIRLPELKERDDRRRIAYTRGRICRSRYRCAPKKRM